MFGYFSRYRSARSSTPQQSKNVEVKAYVRVSKRGSVHIPSDELAELPEVKEMQRMARSIVNSYGQKGIAKQG
ncbi:hypothetical protein ACK6SN_04190 [Proteus mirabilis]|uniref:hypothetical protein n=1 Tax=Proteus mirabilis TaxID=584 RepID=UPI0013D51802|nr:hypothetical protein [Proteus mirabilis]MBS3835640.1 hypothetical protein [Proteus mirabilis]MCT0110799.1 hypothetical protein [Proteus mirabilis]MCZ4671321.1 hypothetical protein [Proteus mirabilis]MDF7417925.1 hypothetical protein [Proteus mirabilis]HEJ9415391.1 hypothetical protein [Proteus mirabilis]